MEEQNVREEGVHGEQSVRERGSWGAVHWRHMWSCLLVM